MAWICGDKINHAMPHHEGVRALWETKWRQPCSINAYPFAYAKIEDMEPIIDELERKGINDAYSDEWTAVFEPYMLRMEKQAQDAEAAGDLTKAEDIHLRASSIGMIARFPIINSAIKRRVWELQKRLHLKGASFWPSPIENLEIPHNHRGGDDHQRFSFYIRRPTASSPTPVYITLGGLDGYRTDTRPQVIQHAIDLGYTSIQLEIPGTGDACGDPSDPNSSDRQMESLLDWIKAQPELDENRVVLFGGSTGGYDAMRLAHTLHDRFAAVIAQGGASDLTFSREWLDVADNGEYPFGITEALRLKFGFDTVEELKEKGRDKFSLVKMGLFDGPCAPLTLLNGVDDTIFPIEDSIVALKHGAPKSARFFDGVGHMGEPGASVVVMQILTDFVKTN